MTTANNTDLEAAIASLSRAIEVIHYKSGTHEEHIAELNTARNAYLAKTASELLPAINKRVLANLRESKPLFVTSEIAKAFSTHAKFLGIFAGNGYDHALSMLQTRLSAYLDESKHGELKGIDAKISDLTRQIEALRTQGKETLDLLRLLQQAMKKNVLLPGVVSEQVAKIAGVARERKLKNAQYQGTKPSQSSSHHIDHLTIQDHDDYIDLMLYMATGFPTSMRTLLLDSIQNHQASSSEIIRGGGGSFGGGGANGDWSSPTSDAPAGNDFSGGAASGAVAAGAGVAAVAVGGVVMANDGFGLSPSDNSSVSSTAIATDDSLGAYS